MQDTVLGIVGEIRETNHSSVFHMGQQDILIPWKQMLGFEVLG